VEAVVAEVPDAVPAGDPEGELLVVGWGSTQGVIEEAVQRVRDEGLKVSAMQMRFIQPMPSGIRQILRRFRKVMTVEGTWADRPAEDELIDEDNRRYAPLAMMLRARTLVDVDCWSEARGQPIKPGNVVKAIRTKLSEGN
jgi:2-oxoglutarate ferredoxin oxidoreductase subunit alpha